MTTKTTVTKKQVRTRVRCAVSGVETGCRPDVFDARVKKYGGIEYLNKRYVCSAAKRMLREGLTVAEIRLKSHKHNDTTLPTEDELKDIISAILVKKAGTSKGAKKIKVAEKVESTGDAAVDAFFEQAVSESITDAEVSVTQG